MRLTMILAAVVLTGCSPGDGPWTAYKPRSPAASKPAIRVIDGDTFAMGAEIIRIENIDAPESGARARCLAEAALAVRAKDQLAELLAVSRGVNVIRSGRDRYGRTLARVEGLNADGAPQDIGAAMVTASVAGQWEGHRLDWCGTNTRATDLEPTEQANDR